MKTTQEGTRVRASFRLYGPLSVIIVFGFAIFFGMAANEVISNAVEMGLLLIPIVFWAFWGLLLWFMLWLNRSKRNDLALYLKSILTSVVNSAG